MDERVAAAQAMFAEIMPFRPRRGVVVMSLLAGEKDWLDAITCVQAARMLHRDVYWAGVRPDRSDVPFSLLRRLQILAGRNARLVRLAAVAAVDWGDDWVLACDHLARAALQILAAHKI
jgi:hypothetical protein